MDAKFWLYRILKRLKTFSIVQSSTKQLITVRDHKCAAYKRSEHYNTR